MLDAGEISSQHPASGIYSIQEKEMRTKAPQGRQDNSPGQAP